MNIDNPVSTILKACKTSEGNFRERFGFSKQFMVDITAGAANRLPDSIHLALRELVTAKGVDVAATLLDGYEESSLDGAYSRWQNEVRRRNAYLFNEIEPERWTGTKSPAMCFIEDTVRTPTTFSKRLCVPPQSVRRWALGQTKKMPEAIYDALLDIDYPWMHELIERQAAWVQEHR